LLWPSTTQTFPERSMWIPCGHLTMPLPKLVTTLPEASNLMTGSRSVRCTHAPMLPPQRSATQTLVPSRSIATALVDPQIRPLGSLAQSAVVRYGFGRSLVGVISGVPPTWEAAGTTPRPRRRTISAPATRGARGALVIGEALR
jgi:hypothetical protein